MTIAERGFSRRQTALLEAQLALFSNDFSQRLTQMLTALEQGLFQQAEQARNNEEQRLLLETLKHMRNWRDLLVPRFQARLETALATLADPPIVEEEPDNSAAFGELSLVETGAMDESVAIKEIATRAEVRNSLCLFLLGQRLGVVARRPAFAAEKLSIGPHRLCAMLRDILKELALSTQSRLHVYRQFETSVMRAIDSNYEAMNKQLIGEGVLPHLTYVTPRNMTARRRAPAPGAAPGTQKIEGMLALDNALPGDIHGGMMPGMAPGMAPAMPPLPGMPGPMNGPMNGPISGPMGGHMSSSMPGSMGHMHTAPATPHDTLPHAHGFPEQALHPAHLPQPGHPIDPLLADAMIPPAAYPQGIPQQGLPQQGLPQQGLPQQGLHHPGAHHPGMPQPGMPQPGMPNPGMPNPGMPNLGISQPGIPAAPGAPSFAPVAAPATNGAPSAPSAPITGRYATLRGVGMDMLPWSRALAPAAPASDGQDMKLFDTLRHLLAGRRSLLDKLKGESAATAGSVYIATSEQVLESLDRIQRRYNTQWAEGGPSQLGDIRHDLLEQIRQEAPDGAVPRLPGRQGETVDLVGLLFEHIAQEVRPDTPGGNLLAQLQLPLLRVALQDQGFFTDRSHPARRMLDAIAETSACWSGDDELDRDLIEKVAILVHRANEESNTNPALFRELMEDLTGHLTTQQRKAEVTERRHVEAARGREKLEIARLKAEEAIEAIIGDKRPPKFLRTLLEQAWTDVLALDLLRGGDDSPAFNGHLELAKRLIDLTCPSETTTPINSVEADDIRKRIEAALTHMGHTSAEANDIGTRLLAIIMAQHSQPDIDTGNTIETKADPASRTELTLKLRKRDRLGQDVQSSNTETDTQQPKKIPLTPEEAACHERLKSLPYGSWFELTLPSGERVRRRMSWFSTITDYCMFVNHRGQRAGDHTLTWLAREMIQGRAQLVEEETRGSIVDRAWKAILSTLRTFSGTMSAKPAAS